MPERRKLKIELKCLLSTLKRYERMFITRPCSLFFCVIKNEIGTEIMLHATISINHSSGSL